jgi:hypothetical protein
MNRQHLPLYAMFMMGGMHGGHGQDGRRTGENSSNEEGVRRYLTGANQGRKRR